MAKLIDGLLIQLYCTIKINSSRGVMRDPKFQFVNSSRELELRDIPQNFVNPLKILRSCGECTVTRWNKLGMTGVIYSYKSLSDVEECIFTAKLNLNLL
jgi:hypothetical protein